MKIIAKPPWRKCFSALLIFGLLTLTLHGQTKKKTGVSAKTPPKQSKPKPAGNNSNLPPSNLPAINSLVSSFATGKRLALVIGNSDYASSPLRNPVNDARLMGESLKALGFDVTAEENLSRAEMMAVIQKFSRGLPRGGVGLFYFAGHGVQINSRNFLIPVDFDIAQSDVAKQGVEVDFVIREISGKSDLNILILDACRNAPAGFSAPAKGLAEIKNAPAGMYIAFSTAPGKTAKDGAGNNSPYTESLASNLRLRPSRLEDVFIRTRIQMDAKTRGEQTPWESSSIRGVFFFAEDTVASNNVTPNKIFNPVNTSSLGKILSLPVVVPVLNESGRMVSQVRHNAAYFVEANPGLEMMQIRGGSFSMGASWQEIETAYKETKKSGIKGLEYVQERIAAEMPRHQVNVPGFFMSKTEITQAQWQAVMGKLPDGITEDLRGPNLPVVNVTWRQANEFCRKISDNSKGKIYRLPTEAEWEYAARAGTDTPFAFGKTITSLFANFRGNFPYLSAAKSEYRGGLIPAGSLQNLNAFGLADMHGNVWEWTADNWHNDYTGAPTDGSAWEADEPDEESAEENDEESGESDEESEDETVNLCDRQDARLVRVIRGGSWDSIAGECRSTSRRCHPQFMGTNKIGFRVVMRKITEDTFSGRNDK